MAGSWVPARGGEVEVVELLLKAGADPNAKAGNGWNGLHEASRWGRDEVVEVLLGAGADANQVRLVLASCICSTGAYGGAGGAGACVCVRGGLVPVCV